MIFILSARQREAVLQQHEPHFLPEPLPDVSIMQFSRPTEGQDLKLTFKLRQAFKTGISSDNP